MLWVYPPKEEEVVEQRKLSDAQKAEIKSIFVLYDANNNGLLEKKELFEALTASGYDDEEIEEMFEEYDQDGSHAIDFDEFCAMLESSYLDS
jgi:calmodulin